MSAIRESTGIPTDVDEHFYETVLVNDKGNCDCKKVGLRTARHSRKIDEHDKLHAETNRFIHGDKATGYRGAKNILNDLDDILPELQQHFRGTDKSNKEAPNENDKFVFSARAVCKFLAWLIGAVGVLASIIFGIIELLS